jgi:hypothetical protein
MQRKREIELKFEDVDNEEEFSNFPESNRDEISGSLQMVSMVTGIQELQVERINMSPSLSAKSNVKQEFR